jgi:hypothetical protein
MEGMMTVTAVEVAVTAVAAGVAASDGVAANVAMDTGTSGRKEATDGCIPACWWWWTVVGE